MSLKTKVDALAMPPKWVFVPTFKNYLQVARLDFGRFYMNSIIISSTTTLLVLAISIPASYVLSRQKFRGRRDIDFWILSTRMAPPVGVLIPYFIIFTKLKLLDTRLSIILMHLSFNLPLAIWIMKGFFREIPKEFEEAAYVDGCNYWQAFFRIIIPTVAGGIVATSILTFIFSWNELMYALTLSGLKSRTATVSLYNFISYEEILWGPLCAAGMIVLIPVFIFVILVQKKLVRGLTFGALKQ